MNSIFKQLTDIQDKHMALLAQGRDNPFSANHRNKMIAKYGYTAAQSITIEDLEQGKRSNSPIN